jgi:starch-binding outer membrane protein SusE/F
MKHYIKFSLGLLVVAAIVVQNCTSDKELNLNLTPISALSAPANNTFVLLKSSQLTTNSVLFQWEQSRAEDGSLVLYDVVFDQEGGDFSNPFFTIVSDVNGVQNKLTMSFAKLNEIAAAGGSAFFERKKFIWTARASKGSNILPANETRTIEVERPGGFEVIPTSLFLTGSATEGGTTLSNAVPMISTGPGKFEIYTKLVPGTYSMVDGITGTPRTFSTVVEEGANVLKPGGSNTFSGSTGAFRIKVDFNTISATSPQEIKRIGYWLCAANDTLATLKYQQRGLWQANDVTINLVNFGWGIDDRYKYRLYFADGSTEFWGFQGADSPGQDGNYPSGFGATYNNAFQGPDVQWDYSWKFDKPAVNGKEVNLLLRFQPPAYKNEYIVQ